jgi:heavy metal translocating P-type ATPase
MSTSAINTDENGQDPEVAGDDHHNMSCGNHDDSKAHSHGWESTLWRAIVAIGLLVASYLIGRPSQLSLELDYVSGGEVVSAMLAFVAALVAGIPLFRHGLKGLFFKYGGGATDQLASLAVLAAMVQGEFTVAVIVALALDLGHLAEERGIHHAGAAIENLIKLSARTAHKLVDGVKTDLPSDELQPKDRVVIFPGEVVPADGVVVSGHSAIDPAHMTGEIIPIDAGPGEKIYHGMINLTGRIEMDVEAVRSDTSLGQVIKALREAEAARPPIVRLLEQYTSVLLPIAILVAAATFVLTRETSRAIAVLVIACPCALILSSPAVMIPALAVAVKKGILVKSGAFLERASQIRTLILDKTGTITLGEPEVRKFVPVEGTSVDDLKKAAVIAASGSNHPIARAIAKAGGKSEQVESTELTGRGIKVELNGREYRLGRLDWVVDSDVSHDAIKEKAESHPGPSSFVSIDGRLTGVVLLSDQLRPEVKETLTMMRKLGAERLVLLTGDRAEVANEIATGFDFDRIEAGSLPEGKAEIVDEEMRMVERDYGKSEDGLGVIYVGDGVNDALALSKSDVGVAMGAMGSEVALKSADIALMTNDLMLLPFLIRLSREVRRIIRMNVYMSVGFAGVLLVLAITGYISPILAAILHPGAALLVIGNSLRVLGIGE